MVREVGGRLQVTGETVDVVGLLGAYSIWGVQSARSSLSAQRTAIDDLSGRLEALRRRTPP